MKSKLMILICLLLLLGTVSPLMAEDIYVSGVTKITMRTGPGTDHKIVAMLSSGLRLTVREYGTDWSMVEDPEGKTGWVLTRFLTKEVPQALQVERLKDENQKLATALDKARSDAAELKTKCDTLSGIEAKYNQLQKASADYLKLDATYKALLKTSQDQQVRIRSLEDQVDKEALYWALAGAGVFLVGLIIGVSTRKKQRNSLL